MKNASFQKTKEMAKIEWSFQNYPQKKFDACILRVSSLENQGYKGIDFL